MGSKRKAYAPKAKSPGSVCTAPNENKTEKPSAVSAMVNARMLTREKVLAKEQELKQAQEEEQDLRRKSIEWVTNAAMNSEEVAIEIVRILNERLQNAAPGSHNLELSKLLNMEDPAPDMGYEQGFETWDASGYPLPWGFPQVEEAGAVQDGQGQDSRHAYTPAEIEQWSTFMVRDVPAMWTRADLCDELGRWDIELGRDVDCVCLIGSGGVDSRAGHKRFGFVNTCSPVGHQKFASALVGEVQVDPLRVEIAKNQGFEYYYRRHRDDTTFYGAAVIDLPGFQSPLEQVHSDQSSMTLSTTADTDLLRRLMDAPVGKVSITDDYAAVDQSDEERVEPLEKLVDGSCNDPAEDLLLRTLQVSPSQDGGKT